MSVGTNAPLMVFIPSEHKTSTVLATCSNGDHPKFHPWFAGSPWTVLNVDTTLLWLVFPFSFPHLHLQTVEWWMVGG